MALTKEQKMMMMLQQQMMQQQIMQQKIQQEQIENNEAFQVAGAIDNILAENIKLKKQLNFNQVRDEKNNVINKGRRKPLDLNKRRTAKKRGGSKKY
jgi:hypothetical protein